MRMEASRRSLRGGRRGDRAALAAARQRARRRIERMLRHVCSEALCATLTYAQAIREAHAQMLARRPARVRDRAGRVEPLVCGSESGRISTASSGASG